MVLPDDDQLADRCASADITVANILAGPLIELADRLIGLTLPGGRLLLTGVLEAQAPQLIERYREVGLRTSNSRDGWILLVGQKPH